MALLVSLLSGCATSTIIKDTLDITYRSDPPGAVLYKGKQSVGFSPHTSRYSLRHKDKINGYISFGDYNSVTAKWPSGAELKPGNSVRLYLNNAQKHDHKSSWYIAGDAGYTQYSIVYDIKRPSGYPGLQQDIGSGAVIQEMQKLKYETEQAKKDAESAKSDAESALQAAKTAQSAAESAKSDAERLKNSH
ncbi:hypothetical protein [Crenothrix polyspora]|uniref:Lipoprotein n=1 Tax=Crenothrix polyspora TaxID=360316 RepID=A0A1R4H051_9GAMM|nr:hypothetical protein [Crenothrix polyspora]SJM89627.1 hypothetical protein CRENPOLYSF1_1140038 [Crenothrix polyspora]